MSDQPFYAPNHTPAPRQPRAGDISGRSGRTAGRSIANSAIMGHGASKCRSIETWNFGTADVGRPGRSRSRKPTHERPSIWARAASSSCHRWSDVRRSTDHHRRRPASLLEPVQCRERQSPHHFTDPARRLFTNPRHNCPGTARIGAAACRVASRRSLAQARGSGRARGDG
jgi:hypothetical protein